MIPNVNPKTSIPYGIISANSLDNEVVEALLYGRQATDLSYQEALEQAKLDFCKQHELEHPDRAFDPDDFDEDSFNDSWYCETPTVVGTYEGVKYQSSWLGGALNFFILESPHTAHCMACSPCVPNAGNLNNLDPDGLEAYTVPSDWLSENN